MRRPGRAGRLRAAFRSDRRGVAAIEFALIAPVMVVLIFATIEVINVLRVQIKLNVAAGQLAEMIAGQSSVTQASSGGAGGSLADMCTAASYNLLPFNPAALSASIASITVSAAPAVTPDWATDKACPTVLTSNATETTALTAIADTPRSLFTVDGTPSSGGGSLVKGYSAISLQANYVYSNIVPLFFSPSITLTSVASARPRSNVTIPCAYPSGNSTAACKVVY